MDIDLLNFDGQLMCVKLFLLVMAYGLTYCT